MSEAAGAALAVALLGLTFALLPPGQRHRARQGALLLAVWVLCGAARVVAAHEARESSIHRLLTFVGIFSLLASMGRSVVLLLLDIVPAARSARPAPRIFRDLSTGVIYLFVALVALRSVDVDPGSILTTSALLTAVVGLAMQDTLGNLVSGLALQMQRPFDVGDWIEVDNGQQAGRVTEVTWRATTVMTLDHVEVILPNAGLAKASIRNYSRPSTVSRRRVVVGVSYAAPPSEVHDALVEATRDVPGVLAEPKPFARTRAFAESSIEHELLFFVDDFGKAVDIDGAVRDRVYHVLARRRIEIPFPTRTLQMPVQADGAPARERDRARRAEALAAVELLQPLPADARRVLADRSELRIYGPGEVVVRKGEPSMELYVIERGVAAVEVAIDGRTAAQVAQLGAGQCFGEMGLLTGEPRSATVRARTLCHLVVVDHDAFHEVLASHPEVVDRLGGLLASRQAALEAATSLQPESQPAEERSRRLISQIRDFFKLV
ncbi:MAG TPA: mechanosensitive ion channel family protein [Polyangiaceae bacterium]|nr:mechanosensitive ion channel family protein [Polyangiaceae bacterium]